MFGSDLLGEASGHTMTVKAYKDAQQEVIAKYTHSTHAPLILRDELIPYIAMPTSESVSLTAMLACRFEDRIALGPLRFYSRTISELALSMCWL